MEEKARRRGASARLRLDSGVDVLAAKIGDRQGHARISFVDPVDWRELHMVDSESGREQEGDEERAVEG